MDDAVGDKGAVVDVRQLPRARVLSWCADLPSQCIVAMESCSTSHYLRHLLVMGARSALIGAHRRDDPRSTDCCDRWGIHGKTVSAFPAANLGPSRSSLTPGSPMPSTEGRRPARRPWNYSNVFLAATPVAGKSVNKPSTPSFM